MVKPGTLEYDREKMERIQLPIKAHSHTAYGPSAAFNRKGSLYFPFLILFFSTEPSSSCSLTDRFPFCPQFSHRFLYATVTKHSAHHSSSIVVPIRKRTRGRRRAVVVVVVLCLLFSDSETVGMSQQQSMHRLRCNLHRRY